MGNPHAVIFGDPSRVRAESAGPAIERLVPGGVNVGFAEPGPDGIDLVVWERGAGLTDACGTGACAAAVAAIRTGRIRAGAPVEVRLPGGALQITVGPDLAVRDEGAGGARLRGGDGPLAWQPRASSSSTTSASSAISSRRCSRRAATPCARPPRARRRSACSPGERFDLLLTDIVMPGMDGIALVRDARARDPELETVAVTGHDDVRLAVDAMKAGCADFLTKPVQRQELTDVVERALERARLRREHSALLGENRELARSQSLFRQCVGILATLDLERLQDLALSVLARATDAQGAAIWIADEKGQLALRGYRGVVDRQALAPKVDPREGDLAASIRAGAPLPGARRSGGRGLLRAAGRGRGADRPGPPHRPRARPLRPGASTAPRWRWPTSPPSR